MNQQRLRQGLKQDPRLLRASLAAKTLLPRLSRKTTKTHLSLEKPRINQMIQKMLSPVAEVPAPESSKSRNPKRKNSAPTDRRHQRPCRRFCHKNSEYQREQYDRAASDIERILDNMAEKAACEELEGERIRELNEAAQSISYGDIHSGVNIRVNRIASVDPELVEQYDAICNPLISISRQLQKSLLRQLKENRRGGKQTGLIMGRRLDAHALCRNDGKVFYKNNLPNEIPELAVGLLLDESGSMCSCDRCTYARAAAIILYDFVKALRSLLWYTVTRLIAMTEKIRSSFTPMPSSTVLTMTISTG